MPDRKGGIFVNTFLSRDGNRIVFAFLLIVLIIFAFTFTINAESNGPDVPIAVQSEETISNDSNSENSSQINTYEQNDGTIDFDKKTTAGIVAMVVSQILSIGMVVLMIIIIYKVVSKDFVKMLERFLSEHETIEVIIFLSVILFPTVLWGIYIYMFLSSDRLPPLTVIFQNSSFITNMAYKYLHNVVELFYWLTTTTGVTQKDDGGFLNSLEIFFVMFLFLVLVMGMIFFLGLWEKHSRRYCGKTKSLFFIIDIFLCSLGIVLYNIFAFNRFAWYFNLIFIVFILAFEIFTFVTCVKYHGLGYGVLFLLLINLYSTVMSIILILLLGLVVVIVGAIFVFGLIKLFFDSDISAGDIAYTDVNGHVLINTGLVSYNGGVLFRDTTTGEETTIRRTRSGGLRRVDNEDIVH